MPDIEPSEQIAPEENGRIPVLNPTEYFESFLNNSKVQEEITKRFNSAKQVDETVTIDEAREAFFRTETAKDLLWSFFRENPFMVDMDIFSTECRTKINAYFANLRSQTIKENLMRTPQSQDEIRNQDEIRSAIHTVAADQLTKDGFAPSFPLARVLIHLMAVSEGLDKADPNRDKRVREVLAAQARAGRL